MSSLYPRGFEMLAAAAAVVFGLLWLGQLPATGVVNGTGVSPEVQNSTLRVNGVSDGPSAGVADQLQGAAAIPQSGDAGSQLQQPPTSEQVQPSSGQSDFNGGSSLQQ